MENDSIQSRPLPTPPTPIRTKKTMVENDNDDEDDVTMGNTEVFHSLKSEKSETVKDQRSSLTLVQSAHDEDDEDHPGTSICLKFISPTAS